MLKKNVFIIFISILTVTSILILLHLCNYLYLISHKNETIEYCLKNDDIKCRNKTFILMIPKLLIHNVRTNGKKLDYIMLDSKPRLTPCLAAKKSDVLFGYGILDDIDFERFYGKIFNKQVYAFDCGIEKITWLKDDELADNIHFKSECIGTDKYILDGQISSEKIHTFGNKIKELGLNNKKIYLKMDIAGAEVDVIPEILKYSDQITAINLTLHIDSSAYIIERLKTLDEINKNFILIARHPFYPVNYKGKRDKIGYPYYTGELFNDALELLYINKNLADDKGISFIQNNNILFKLNKNYTYIKNIRKYDIPKDDVSFVVTLTEILKNNQVKLHSAGPSQP